MKNFKNSFKQNLATTSKQGSEFISEQSLKKISNEELQQRLESLVRHERKLTVLVIEHIAEVERRKLFIDWGFSSMYDYLTKSLQYSESSAYRRLQAARALQQVPEIKEEIEAGTLNLSQVAAAQSGIRKEEKAMKQKVSLDAKRDLFMELKNKTSIETQRCLDAKLPLHERHKSITHHKQDGSLDINLNIPVDLLKDIEKIKQLYSHIIPDGNWIDVLRLMAKDVIQKRDTSQSRKPMKKSVECSSNEPSTSSSQSSTQRFAAAEVHEASCKESSESKVTLPKVSLTTKPLKAAPTRVALPAAIKRFVYQRDLGKCQHRISDGHICGSRYQLEIDHIQPVFAAGSNESSNLRLLCRAHNQNRYRRSVSS